jgi:hypothetical protein
MTCTICNQEKDDTEFCINNSESRGRDYFCKTCKKAKKLEFYRTKRGVIVTIYDSQKASSKRRRHPEPSYTLEELYEWAINQEIFHVQYELWVESDYSKMDKPSIDRENDFKPYTFDNIQIISYQENYDKGTYNRLNGITSQGKL